MQGQSEVWKWTISSNREGWWWSRASTSVRANRTEAGLVCGSFLRHCGVFALGEIEAQPQPSSSTLPLTPAPSTPANQLPLVWVVDAGAVIAPGDQAALNTVPVSSPAGLESEPESSHFSNPPAEVPFPASSGLYTHRFALDALN